MDTSFTSDMSFVSGGSHNGILLFRVEGLNSGSLNGAGRCCKKCSSGVQNFSPKLSAISLSDDEKSFFFFGAQLASLAAASPQ